MCPRNPCAYVIQKHKHELSVLIFWTSCFSLSQFFPKNPTNTSFKSTLPAWCGSFPACGSDDWMCPKCSASSWRLRVKRVPKTKPFKTIWPPKWADSIITRPKHFRCVVFMSCWNGKITVYSWRDQVVGLALKEYCIPAALNTKSPQKRINRESTIRKATTQTRQV